VRRCCGAFELGDHRPTLERLWVVYPGKTGYQMDEKIECVPLGRLDQIKEGLQ